MKIFVISLARATERRAESARQFIEPSLDFEFFDAIERVSDAFQHFSGFDQRLFGLNTGRLPLPGEIGCFASHKAVWKKCIDLNEPVIILEDDFLLVDGFAEKLAEIESLIKTFGFIRLQNYKREKRLFRTGQWRCDYRLPDQYEGRLRYLSHVPLCLLAYGIDPVAANALVRNCNILGAPVDKYVQKTWVHSAPVFALEEPVVTLSPCAQPSTIGIRTEKSRNIGFLAKRLIYKAAGEVLRARFNRKQMQRLRISSPSAFDPAVAPCIGSQQFESRS